VYPCSELHTLELILSSLLFSIIYTLSTQLNWTPCFLKFRWCSSSRKLVILFVVIAAAVIVLGLGALFLLFALLSFQRVSSAIHVRPYESCNMTLKFGYLMHSWESDWYVLSMLYPPFIHALSMLYPCFVHALSMLYPHFIHALSMLSMHAWFTNWLITGVGWGEEKIFYQKWKDPFS